MTRWLRTLGITGAAIVIAALLATGIVGISFGGTDAGAQESNDADVQHNALVPPSQVAVAIGQLEEEDGEYATVDLRAAVRDGDVGGALRFFSEEYGYYNGGVRTLEVADDGTIHVTGAGGLFHDGARTQVRYDATFAPDGATSIHVQGRGVNYTMAGHLDGLVSVWNAPALAE